MLTIQSAEKINTVRVSTRFINNFRFFKIRPPLLFPHKSEPLHKAFLHHEKDDQRWNQSHQNTGHNDTPVVHGFGVDQHLNTYLNHPHVIRVSFEIIAVKYNPIEWVQMKPDDNTTVLKRFVLIY